MSKFATTEELHHNNISSKNIDYFCDKDKMEKYIKKIYPQFYENFELNNFIKRGAGYIYKGKCKYNNQKYVFKICIKEKRTKKKKEETQEISIIKKLHHKNITQIVEFVKMDENTYMSIFQYEKYGDLNNFVKNILKREILSETCINYFAKQILDSLEYIHRCKIVHFDLKPENIIVDSNLTIKINDFSSSISYSESNPEDLVKFPFVGTGKYMSPEIIERSHMKNKYAQKIDIYSFGVTLYYLTFGKYPYQLNDILSKDYEKILEKIKSVNLEFPQEVNISEKFKDFLSKILEKDYLKRINIKEALEHPWIKGADIIIDEKEKVSYQEQFLFRLINDNIPEFNEYIKIKS